MNYAMLNAILVWWPAYVMVGCLTAFFCIGYVCGSVRQRHKWQDELIRRRHGRFNWSTGKWEWGRPPTGIENEIPSKIGMAA